MSKPIQMFFLLGFFISANAQDRMTPELLWSLNRVSAAGLTKDGQNVVFSITKYDLSENTRMTGYYLIPVTGGDAVAVENYNYLITDNNLSSDGKNLLSIREVKVNPVAGSDFYPKLNKSNVYIFNNLNYRHWDQWEDGKFSHVFIHPVVNGKPRAGLDIMPHEPYDCPQQPFGGSEDYLWNKSGTRVLYVAKKKAGTEYATSTNTDIYAYDLTVKTTTNLTADNKGYDTQPAFSKEGNLAWLQMQEDGYESDKNDIVVKIDGSKVNLTKDWDGTVNAFLWSEDGNKIYFNAAIQGTVQLFEVNISKDVSKVRQISDGQFNINSLAGQSKDLMVVSRSDMNHAAELYAVNLKNGQMQQLTHVNDSIFDRIKLSKIEKRLVTTTDGKQMPTWVIYPPDFDPSKVYPTLLYCQGGPQSALSQFYSYRWNFQLMAAQGYIVVAPNRRGMPGLRGRME